jgi:hypothetical protein
MLGPYVSLLLGEGDPWRKLLLRASLNLAYFLKMEHHFSAQRDLLPGIRHLQVQCTPDHPLF